MVLPIIMLLLKITAGALRWGSVVMHRHARQAIAHDYVVDNHVVVVFHSRTGRINSDAGAFAPESAARCEVTGSRKFVLL